MSELVPSAPVRIVVIDPEGRKRTAEFSDSGKDPIRIGRAPENDIQLISPYISRRHAEVWPDERGAVFVDLSSTSGSYVDGTRVDKVILRVGEATFLGSPDGLRLSIQSLDSEEDTLRDGSNRTEVLRVAELGSSAYLTSTGRLFPGGEAQVSADVSAAALKTEKRLIGLITLTSELLEVKNSGEMAERLLEKVFDLLAVERGMVLLDENEQLAPHAWKSRKDSHVIRAELEQGPKTLEPALNAAEPRPNAPFSPIRTVTSRVFREGVGLLSLDASSDQRLEGSKSVLLQSIRSIMCAPIASAKDVYGVLYVDTHETVDETNEDDLDWLVAVAHQAGMVMEKLMVLDQRQRMTESLMKGLAASIDARDGLTAGHSARVAHYSVGIAQAMDVSVEDQYAIYYAALLHDYGKIGIDDAVLKKPGRLTPEEFEHIKLHPKFTYDILSKIEFPPELDELPMMAASHHERWDGTGYPWGLKGETIPLAGRIIAIADVYDSLTRKRHYRDPMPVDEVLSYLEEGRASHFDPVSLDAFFLYHQQQLADKERRRLAKKGRSADSNGHSLEDQPTGGLDHTTASGVVSVSEFNPTEALSQTDPKTRASHPRMAAKSYSPALDSDNEITSRIAMSSTEPNSS